MSMMHVMYVPHPCEQTDACPLRAVINTGKTHMPRLHLEHVLGVTLRKN